MAKSATQLMSVSKMLFAGIYSLIADRAPKTKRRAVSGVVVVAVVGWKRPFAEFVKMIAFE